MNQRFTSGPQEACGSNRKYFISASLCCVNAQLRSERLTVSEIIALYVSSRRSNKYNQMIVLCQLLVYLFNITSNVIFLCKDLDVLETSKRIGRYYHFEEVPGRQRKNEYLCSELQ